MAQKAEIHIWRAPAGYTFEVTLQGRRYRVEVFKGDKLIERSGVDGSRRLQWGASASDALMMACYSGDPKRAVGVMSYLFTRIDRDFEGDRTLIADLFAEAVYVGIPGVVATTIARAVSGIAVHTCGPDYVRARWRNWHLGPTPQMPNFIQQGN